jgi:hypothetical protein
LADQEGEAASGRDQARGDWEDFFEVFYCAEGYYVRGWVGVGFCAAGEYIDVRQC